MVVLQGQSSGMMMIIMVIIIVFFMVIPAIRRNRNEKKFKETLKKGAKVVTTGGIHGRLLEVSEESTTVLVETGAGKLRLEKSSISMELTKKVQAA